MNPQISIVSGGIFCVCLVLFHLTFWRLFRWNTELAKLTSLNRAVVQVLNLSLTFVFVIFAYVSLAHTTEMESTPLGRSLLLLIALLWYLRAIEQVYFFGLRTRLSVLFLVFFVLGGTLYLIPLIG